MLCPTYYKKNNPICILVSPSRSTCLTHHKILDLITLDIILNKYYLWQCSKILGTVSNKAGTLRPYKRPRFSNSSDNEQRSNQKDATNFSFIYLFKSALHVSGDKFVHPQEHFLNVYTAFGTMHRHCCRPVPRLTVAPFGSRGVALNLKLYIKSKSASEDGRICRPKHVGLN